MYEDEQTPIKKCAECRIRLYNLSEQVVGSDGKIRCDFCNEANEKYGIGDII